ncbi:ankyrin repeat domain-containing protein [Endozoicomonas sp. SCSIO W0465]|uniref:ankyrin repeat domain-containing protein n=1 Tax=Endozoicomonas sp. SCSIO W0465 TaxID=2918516 RepID=UPI002075B9A7|nr:ankyrin repeat domain-containing protein [Endozoicomonas sp. SCSIO W0465]USE38534.1 ankyrin repeat domain-containing protein [Endozoicomonas sp. SCSIO W0465]
MTSICQHPKTESLLPALPVFDTGNRDDWSAPLNAFQPTGLVNPTAPPKATGEPGYPLHWAITNHEIESLSRLIAIGEMDINGTDMDGLSPLHLAALQGNIECLELLLMNAPGVLVNAKVVNGISPLCLAACNGHSGCVEVLLNAPGIMVNDKADSGWTPLSFAANNGHSDCVRALLRVPGIMVNEKDADGWTPLSLAAHNGHDGCLVAILNALDVRVNEKINAGMTPLCIAALNGYNRCIEALLSAVGIRVNETDDNGWTPLSLAAHNGHDECVKALLRAHGILVNKKNHDGWTPLCLAAARGYEEIVKALLSAPGILINEKNIDGLTPLHCATGNGHEVCMWLLIASQEMKIMLLNAAYEGQPGVLAEVLGILNILEEPTKSEAVMLVLNLADRDGKTLTFLAAQSGCDEVVALCLNALKALSEWKNPMVIRAALSVADRFGRTPLYIAAFLGHDNIVTRLLSAFTEYHDVVRQLMNVVNGLPKAEKVAVFGTLAGAVDQFKRKPLSVPVDNSCGEVVDQLIQAFPLLSAVLGKHKNSVKQLMQALQALPGDKRSYAIMTTLKKTRAEDGATPLYIAVSLGSIKIIKSLLGSVFTLLTDGKRKEAREVLYCACRVEKEDRAMEGITPLRIAVINRHGEAVKLLLDAKRKLFSII